MKFTAFFLLAACLQIYGKGAAQITISEKKASLENVLKIVKNQSGYAMVYDVALVKQKGKPLSIYLKNASVEEALKQIFKTQILGYEITAEHLILITDETPLHQIEISKPSAPPLPALIEVKGTVKDEEGNPIIRASVIVKGANNGTYTNEQGSFSLSNVNEDATLYITSTSTEPAEVKVNGRATLTITVKTKITEIEDVVVTVNTGYQRLQPHQMTGAATALSQKKYDQRVAVTGNFLESLEGKLPGLVYNSQSGELSIRGVATFDAVKQPLIIVDGFATEIDLRTINPIEIISVTVLRDAAASAIYGVRASNGVIVIETVRGKSEKATVDFRATTAIQDKPDFGYLNYAPASEFALLEKELTENDPSPFLYYDYYKWPLSPVGLVINDRKKGRITEEEASQQIAEIGKHDNLQEYKNLFYQNRLSNNINLSASGGSSKSSYLLGFNYVGDQAVERRSKSHQYSLNIANTYQFSDRIKFDFKANYTNIKNVTGETPSYGGFLPYEHLVDGAGNALPTTYASGSSGSRITIFYGITKQNNDIIMSNGLYDKLYYPYRELFANTTTNKGSSIRLQGRFNIKLASWISMDIGGAFENQDTRTDLLRGELAYATRLLLSVTAEKDAITGKAVFKSIPQGDMLRVTNEKSGGYTLRGQLNIDKYYGNKKHYISGIMGIEQRKITSNAFTTTYFGYDGQTLLNKPVNLLAFSTLGFSNPSFPDFGYAPLIINYADYYNEKYNDQRFMSYYSNMTYEFLSKYIATGSIRLDQSNLFGADPKYRNKPLWSAGLAWRVNKEDFLNNYSFIDDLKLRLSTGFTGNIPRSSNGKFLILSSGINTSQQVPQQYYNVSSPKNESLRWETTNNYNAGIDFAFLDYKLSGAIDYYIKNSTDVFGSFDSDPTTGFNSYNTNTASIQNKGLELMINTIHIRHKNFEWATQFTASYNSNKVISVKEKAEQYSAYIAFELNNVKGRPINSLYSYNYGGLTNLGQPYALTQKGEKVVLNLSTADVAREDLIYSGTTTPKYVFGLNNQFTFGPIDVSFLIMYYGGHVMRVRYPNIQLGQLPSFLNGALNYWKKPGDELTTLIPAIPKNETTDEGYYSSDAQYAVNYAHQFVRKADYLRLRDVVITYNINSKPLKKMGFTQPQIRLQAQNAYRYTFSGNDIDPEAIEKHTGYLILPRRPVFSISFFTKF